MNKSYVKYFLVLAAVLLFTSCGKDYPFLETADNVELDRYLGKWYEIASFPNSFQEGCNCTSAEYSIIDSVTVKVINKCTKYENGETELDEAEGKAFVVPNTNNSKLKVQFFWPFKGDYWIIELDQENYQYVVVASPSRKYLWILARTKSLDKTIYNDLVERSRNKGFDISKLKLTKQDCDFYY